MNTKPLRVAGLVSLIMGILFVLTGAVTWGVVSSQLAAERITVPQDAAFSAGAKVQGPISALAQADTINKHALAAAATQARNAGDTAKADELTKQRTTVMNGSFLRASLFTSVLSFGVCLFAIGVGLTLIVIGWALNRAASSVPATATVRT